MRLELNAEDLAKVRVSSTWGPFNEALLSLHSLRDTRPARRRRSAMPTAIAGGRPADGLTG